MKLGILGTGMIVKDMLRMINKLGLESIYLLGTEATKEETGGLCAQYGLTKAYFDYDELLVSDVDTIYVALPNFLHYSFAKKALEHDKHVIIEKPITANFRELEELSAIAKERKRIVLEAMNIHYLPAYCSIKENLDKLGDLKVVSFNYSQYSHRYDSFKCGETLPVFDPAKAGGSLMDLNVYNIHAIVGLFGKPERVQYFANVEKGIDTSGILLMDYGTFKAVTIGAKDCKAPVVSTLQGDKGYIRISIPVNQVKEYELNDNDGHSEVISFEEEHRLYYEFVEFIKMIDGGDYERAEAMLTVSKNVSQVMEEARKQEGIVFRNDQ